MDIKRILMNAADGGGSGGSPPPAPGAPAPQPQAQGAAPPAVDVDAIASKVTDSVFAAMRRAGVFEQKKPKGKDDGDGAPAPQPAPPQQADTRRLERALNRSGLGTRLKSDAQYDRIERAFAVEAPTDVDAWLKDYFGEAGTAQTQAGASGQAAQQTTTQQQQRQQGPPASDGGSPGNNNTPIEERPLIGMSQADVEHLIKTKGLKWYREKFTKEMSNTRVRLTSG